MTILFLACLLASCWKSRKKRFCLCYISNKATKPRKRHPPPNRESDGIMDIWSQRRRSSTGNHFQLFYECTHIESEKSWDLFFDFYLISNKFAKKLVNWETYNGKAGKRLCVLILLGHRIDFAQAKPTKDLRVEEIQLPSFVVNIYTQGYVEGGAIVTYISHWCNGTFTIRMKKKIALNKQARKYFM